MIRPPVEDLRIRGTQPLLSPAALAAELPLDDADAGFVARSRHAVEEIILGHDDRLLVVVGPCSIHDTAAAICGVMLESNLLDGAQSHRTTPLVYGRSVTDPCLAWKKTLPVLAQLASAVRARRSRTRRPRPSLDPSDSAPLALLVTW
jgi:3-deoxy-D-arabino-heptulosonate 7-phosphate (DAHP) synthase